MMRAIKMCFGVLSILIGGAIILWFIYNQFNPTEDYQRSFKGVFQLVLPGVMIWIGWIWLTERPQSSKVDFPYFVFIRINESVDVQGRKKYIRPIEALLSKGSIGEVTGSGTELAPDGTIDHFGIDLSLADTNRSVEAVRELLKELGAPVGSQLELERDGQMITIPIQGTDA